MGCRSAGEGTDGTMEIEESEETRHLLLRRTPMHADVTAHCYCSRARKGRVNSGASWQQTQKRVPAQPGRRDRRVRSRLIRVGSMRKPLLVRGFTRVGFAESRRETWFEPFFSPDKFNHSAYTAALKACAYHRMRCSTLLGHHLNQHHG